VASAAGPSYVPDGTSPLARGLLARLAGCVGSVGLSRGVGARSRGSVQSCLEKARFVPSKSKENPVDATLLAGWRLIAEQNKTFLGWPVWSEPTPVKPKTPTRAELQTSAAETVHALVQLADAGGVGIEGVRLRLSAWAYRRLYEVTATLEVVGGRSHVTIARVDGWPAICKQLGESFG
jgi:hypothetical protein